MQDKVLNVSQKCQVKALGTEFLDLLWGRLFLPEKINNMFCFLKNNKKYLIIPSHPLDNKKRLAQGLAWQVILG